MYIAFFVFALGAMMAVPIHFRSVEHTKLQEKYGREKGCQIGELYGRFSADLLFLSLIGLWVSSQPRFTIPVFQSLHILIPVLNLSVPVMHLLLFILFAASGSWVLVESVTALSRRVSETHQVEKVITSGIYARVRHPQHLGFLLIHIGASFLVSGWYALLATPMIFIILYLIARKEEVELTKEFRTDYERYKNKVSMFIPR